MIEVEKIYLAKAEECLEGAESEFANGRYNNCANRCYHACFQAAIHGLITDGGPALVSQRQWRHAFVQSRFVGEFVNRRQTYPTELRSTLADNLTLRHRGDYEARVVSEVQAARALRRTRIFVAAVRSRGG